MFDQSLDLADVLAHLRRADESLAEFIAPLWPGVSRAAAWIEGKPRLFPVTDVPETEGYYLLGIAEDSARVLRPAEDDEANRYRRYLTNASVILLEDGLAFPASSVERLQGIDAPWPIHFAHEQPLQMVRARFDGVNLLYDGLPSAEKNSPLEELFGAESIFSPGALGIPGEELSTGSAAAALDALHIQPDSAITYRLHAVLQTAGAVLEEWTRVDGQIRVHWRRLDEEHTIQLRHAASPITSGISLAGARGFDPATLSRLLVEHILDAWRV